MGKRTIELEGDDFAFVLKVTELRDGLGNVTGQAQTVHVYVGDEEIGLVSNVAISATSGTTPEIRVEIAGGLTYENVKRMPVELKDALDGYAGKLKRVQGVHVDRPFPGPRGRGGDFVPTTFPIPSGIIRPTGPHGPPTGAGQPSGPHGPPSGAGQPSGHGPPSGQGGGPTGPHGPPSGAGQPDQPTGVSGATGPTGPSQPTGGQPTSPGGGPPSGAGGGPPSGAGNPGGGQGGGGGRP